MKTIKLNGKEYEIKKIMIQGESRKCIVFSDRYELEKVREHLKATHEELPEVGGFEGPALTCASIFKVTWHKLKEGMDVIITELQNE